MSNRIIRYAIESETGHVWSRVGDEIAGPVLQWDKMLPENNFTPTYELEKFSVHEPAIICAPPMVWTRKIPVELKNRHREFWGFKLLPVLADG